MTPTGPGCSGHFRAVWSTRAWLSRSLCSLDTPGFDEQLLRVTPCGGFTARWSIHVLKTNKQTKKNQPGRTRVKIQPSQKYI